MAVVKIYNINIYHPEKKQVVKKKLMAFGGVSPQSSGFSQTHNIGNNAKYWHQNLYYVKTKKSNDKMLLPAGIEPGLLINL